MPAFKPLIALLALCVLLVACPKKNDEKGKVPFGLDDKKDHLVTKEQPKKDAAKEAGSNDGGTDGGDAGLDAAAPITPEQAFREALVRSLRVGKLDEEIKAEPLEKVRKLGPLPLRGVTPPVSLSRLHGVEQHAPTDGAGPVLTTLLIRGPGGGTFPADTELRTNASPQSAAIEDPMGRYTVVEKKIDCEGVRLVIANSNEIVAGVLAGKPVSKPWVLQNNEPTQCNKAELEPLTFKVLGWTGQGIVFFLDGEFFVQESPLSSDTLPRKIELGPGLPAPLPEGFVATDGRTVVLPTKVGFLVYVSGQAARVATDPHIGSESQVTFARDGDHLDLYWTYKGALYHTTLPFLFGGKG